MPLGHPGAECIYYVTAPSLSAQVLSGEHEFFSFALENDRATDVIAAIQAVVNTLGGQRSARLEKVLQELDSPDPEALLATALAARTTPLKLVSLPEVPWRPVDAGLVSA